MSDGAGTPPSDEELRQRDQSELLSGVIQEALRLMPTPSGGATDMGLGHGDGPDPKSVEVLAGGLRELHQLMAPQLPVLDWLTSSVAGTPAGGPGDFTLAALAVRDLLVAGLAPGPEFEQPDSEAEAEEEVRVAELFATGTVETA